MSSVTGMWELWPARKVRDTFIKFFTEREHTQWPSDSVFTDDDGLLFANDGMDQFKPIILGTVDPSTELSKLKRACSIQKWIRPGISHKDLENVGSPNYHHTFFEVLGNWSFGDYFKEEAIGWAWELLTNVYGLPTDQIYATYFGGDEKARLPPDIEARDIWLKYLPSQRVLSLGYKFDKGKDGSLESRSAKHVDSKMGFERLTSLLQHRLSSYDTDLFFPLYEEIHMATGIARYDARRSTISEAYRVVADHIKMLSIAFVDPGNEGCNNVLRRIFQRAVRYGMAFLNAREGFFSNRVAKTVVRVMGDVFTELQEHEDKVIQILRQEESVFCKIMQFVLDLTDEKNPDDLRALALHELTNYLDQDLAHLLWSMDAIPVLVTEIAFTHTSFVLPSLWTYSRANHVLRLFCLLKCVSQISEARVSLLEGQVHKYLYHFVESTSTTSAPIELMRIASLTVLEALVKADYPNDDVNKLIYSGIVLTCLRSFPVGSIRAREVAVSIVEEVLNKDVGLIYIATNRQLLIDVLHGLGLLVSRVMMELPHLGILKSTIRCFQRLSENESIRVVVRPFARPPLRDNTYVELLQPYPSALESLLDLQNNLM